jgi:hypothetical protein
MDLVDRGETVLHDWNQIGFNKVPFPQQPKNQLIGCFIIAAQHTFKITQTV